MARSPVTEVIDRYNALSEVEQKVFLDLVDPQPEQEPTKVKRTRKSRKGLPAASTKDTKPDEPKANGQLCIAKIPGLGVDCNDPEDNKVHDKNAGYAGYHPFTPPAQSAPKRSSRKGAGTNSTPSTEGEKASALGVGASGD